MSTLEQELRAATGHDFLQRPLAEVDPDIAGAIRLETARQNDTLELIASENHVSKAVLTAMGSVFTNKYADGYPGKRYYGGCGPTDIVENIAIDRAKKLFGAEHANVQPHAGSQANMAVYFTVLKPGDTIMGMDLSHGGHLTHGHPLSYSGRDFNVVAYHVRKEDERIDYDAMQPEFREYQAQIIRNAQALAQAVADEGFRIVSGGTDNHVFMTDVFSKGITGKDGQNWLEAANITVNKNTIPFDTQKPMVASGLRIGSPAVTTRGLREPEMKTIARLIARVLDSKGDPAVTQQVKGEVKQLCDRFPIY